MRLRAFIFAVGFFAFGVAVAPLAIAADPVPSFQPLTGAGIHNLFSLGAGIYSGSAPEGKEGFETLKKLGIKTIISVDGSKPEVELAHQYGFRYVHIPIGYDGVYETNAIRLVKAAETVPGPIFVHCHHGMHRGPAGAAVICKGIEGWDDQTALAWLKAAGTATNYTGLFQTVKQFQPPTKAVLDSVSTNFPEKVEVSALVDAMVAIDERWDHLKEIKQAGYKSPASHPDLVPVNESAVLHELFRELVRSGEPQKRGEPFAERMKTVAQTVADFSRQMERVQNQPGAEAFAQLDKTYQAVTDSCASCHKAYRNPLKSKP